MQVTDLWDWWLQFCLLLMEPLKLKLLMVLSPDITDNTKRVKKHQQTQLPVFSPGLEVWCTELSWTTCQNWQSSATHWKPQLSKQSRVEKWQRIWPFASTVQTTFQRAVTWTLWISLRLSTRELPKTSANELDTCIYIICKLLALFWLNLKIKGCLI